MAGMIPQSFIDNLLDRVDIVEVVDHRVKLKKTGKNYSACCPFHDEKTPSFTVSPEKQFFYCFGCGASGNAVGFIMDYERLSFPESVEQLARVAGLEVPRELQTEAQVQREEEKRSIYTLLEKAGEFYQAQLRQHPSKHMAVTYLKRRGLDGKIAKEYGVGFAPPGWDNLLKALATNDEDKHLLIEGGMLIHQPDEKKIYDRFRHRIMFPIRDTRGRVIGFGGRVLGDDKPKYLNSPETPVFHKGQELYGLYEARLAYRDLPRLLVVEGYMDVVSLAQFGIRYGVATLGTACGEDHLDRAFRYTNEVVFCFDGDKAGRAAAHRALESSLAAMKDGRLVKFLFLPEGEDPDTLVRQIGPEKFERMVDLAVPLEDFLFDAVAEGINIRTMEGRASFSKRAAPFLDKLPKGVFRELMFENLATRTGLSRSVLQELVSAPASLTEPAPIVPVKTPVATSIAPANLTAPVNRRDQENKPEHQTSGDYTDEDYLARETPPPDYEEYYSEPQTRRAFTPQYQPQLSPGIANKYLMPPARKAIALLLTHPGLASAEADHETWLLNEQNEWQMLGRLLKLLHERPHYNLSHIIGYWRGTYGADDAEKLARIAGHDLLQAANALTRTRDDKPAKADYDTLVSFCDCISNLRQELEKSQQRATLDIARQTDFNQLTKEQKDRIRDALIRPTPLEK
jgi:DNA primase